MILAWGVFTVILSAGSAASPLQEPPQTVVVEQLSADPGDSLYRAGVMAISEGEYSRASTLFKELTDLYPQSERVADALYWRAFALYRLGGDADLREARHALRLQRRRFPQAFSRGDAAALEQRILGELAQRGDPDAARIITDQSKRLFDPNRLGASCDTANASAPSNDIKVAALNALVRMNPDRAVATLQEILRQQDRGSTCLRRTAVLLLVQQNSPDVTPIMLETARTDPDREVRKQAVLYLSQFTTDEAIVALDSFVRTSGDPELVQSAVLALSQSANPRAQEALRTYAARDDLSQETRRTVIAQLLERQSAENTMFLQQLYGRLGPEDLELRRGIIQAVGQLGDPANTGWLLDIAQRESANGSGLHTQALVLATRTATPEQLAAVYIPELDAPLRMELLDTYSRYLEHSAVLDVLGSVARRDPDRGLRRQAVMALSRSPNPHAADVLQTIVEEGP